MFQITIVRPKARRAFTLIEAVVALAIAGVATAALVSGFVLLHRSSETTVYSLAANALAVQGYERVRAARWDAMSFPNVDDVVSSNFPPRAAALDVAGAGTNLVYATNYTTITTLSTNPLLKAVRVDCVYSLNGGGRHFTNTIVGYRATETGQQNFQQSAPPPTVTLPPPVGTGSVTNSRTVATNANNAPGTVYVTPPAPNGGKKPKKAKK